MAKPVNISAEQDEQGRWYVEFPLDGTLAWLRCKNEAAARRLAKAMRECIK